MSVRVHGVWAVLLAAGMLLPAETHAAPSHASNVRRAEALAAKAQRRLQRGGIESRRLALRDLEQATLLDPANPAHELLLARTYYDAGFLGAARARFEKVARLAPEDPNARFGLGLVWGRDWLKYLEPSSLDRAVEQYSMAARLHPEVPDAWIKLVPLLVEKGSLREAARAADRGLEADRRSETLLAVAYTSYRMGRVLRADSLFAIALPTLPKIVRDRFDDIAPVASAEDTFRLHRMTEAQQVQFVQRFWKEQDPDLASPENEALLEYWSRVAHAYFLFYNPRRREWDERGEVYVRYGAPTKATYNPVGENLTFRFATGPGYPMNSLLWEYPELGMRVHMQDRLLSEYYLLPIVKDHDPDPKPFPDSLARLRGSIATAGGRGVFSKLPPGATPIPVDGRLARFESSEGPRLLAQVQTAGGPADSVWADWVVLDTARTVIVRERRPLSSSACEVTEWRLGDFARALAPGRYLVGLTVHNDSGGRGAFREEIVLSASPSRLSMSDVVVSCGAPQVLPGSPSVRIEPNPKAMVGKGDPLRAYFEIYHLAQGADGLARCEFQYSVKSAEKDPRVWIQRVLQPRARIPDVSASREVELVGDLRRQFLTVPLPQLPAGKYRLEITVRDRVSGGQVTGSAAFVKG